MYGRETLVMSSNSMIMVRKETKKGAFPNENALLKVLFLRVKELEAKGKRGHIQNWSMVINQLLLQKN